MRISEAWLREFTNPAVNTDQLVKQLTMAGMEIDGVIPVSGSFSDVLVGYVLEVNSHPEADRLQVCLVNAGLGKEALQIVCGAPNVYVGMKVPVAVEGAELPGGIKIKPTKLRGVQSQGMLCSSKELGIEDDSSGLMELAEDAAIGLNLRDYLELEDSVIELDLTPNRADCLSVEGVAREVALLNQSNFSYREDWRPKVSTEKALQVSISASKHCPVYVGRYIEGINHAAKTPLWIKERLRRSGIRSLSPIVDITNYVMLELGQPLHAFDADKISGGIEVREAKPGESLRLLNDQEINLSPDTLVIADSNKPLALAGIMGGKESAVGPDTTNLFIESAYFAPSLIMGKARKYGLSTDSSHRFERGVSFELQERAINRVCELVQQIAGGHLGPLVQVVFEAEIPIRERIHLKESEISRVLSLDSNSLNVDDILIRLGMMVERSSDGWFVTPPAFRFDIVIEADLIEELGRIYGYDRLPIRSPNIPAVMRPSSEGLLNLDRVKDVLVDLGYQEAITYSFVADELQRLIDPASIPLKLKNPISSELAVMRTNLWVGLLDAAIRNCNRQQRRVRLFETGLKFLTNQNDLIQAKSIAFLALGSVFDEQWGHPQRLVDFFDVKADVEAIVALTGKSDGLSFVPIKSPTLHPGQSAEIFLDGSRLGSIGMLHPSIEKELGFEQSVFLVELDQDALLSRSIPSFKKLSKFPSVRRDLAFIVDESVHVGDLLSVAKKDSDCILKHVSVFDVYQGKGIESYKKSVAISLFLQDEEDTLTEARVEEAVFGVVNRLIERFNARLRD
jgi:phenylalanyl-tRNA synthetase beta chain